MSSILSNNASAHCPFYTRSRIFMVVLKPVDSKSTTNIASRPDFRQQLRQLALPADVESVVADFPTVFPDDLPQDRPPERDIVHSIPVKDDHIPFARSPYRMSPAETSELKRQIDDLLQSGKIQPSKGCYAAPVLFVSKPDGSLRLCIDYRRLNRDTKQDHYPLPHMHDLLDRLSEASFFTVMDLRSGFWQVPVDSKDTAKTAFITPFGLFEWIVMPFGLTSAPATFQRLVNTRFSDCTGFVQAYLDDFIVFSNTREEHLRHLRLVLERLSEHQLYVKLSKCQFVQQEVEYVGHIVARGHVRIHPRKIEAVTSLQPPKDRHGVQTLLGMVNWIRRFLPQLATVATPITDLLRKDQPFIWGETQQQSLDNIKKLVTEHPTLSLPRRDLPYLLQTDASDYALAGALLQQHPEGNYHVICYESRRFRDAERNYTVRDKELLAIVHCLRSWRHLLLGSQFQIQTDHKTLEYLQTQASVNQRHARWLELIGEFGALHIEHISGPRNGLADALSRLDSTHLDSNDHTYGINSISSSSRPYQLCRINSISSLGPDSALLDSIRKAYTSDKSTCHLVGLNNHRYKTINGLVYFSPDNDHRVSSRLLIPNDDKLKTILLKEAHEPDILGHRGQDSTYFNIHRFCYWSGMLKDCRLFVRSCEICQRTKQRNLIPTGMLQPLAVPPHNWHTVSIDFAVDLPLSSNGKNAIMVVVDKLSKRCHLIPCRTTDKAQDIANLYFTFVFSQHALPSKLISDRDPKFTSCFWKALADACGTTLSMSTADHPQSDGQTENMVKQCKECLRHYLNYEQNNWEKLLPAIEFAINSTPNRSTGYTPFELDTGRIPTTPASITLDPAPSDEPAQSAQAFLDHIQAAMQDARDSIARAQDRQALQANKSRHSSPFKIGDLVLVSTKHLLDVTQRNRPSTKLRRPFTGPFLITDIIGTNAVKLNLPDHIRAHSTFNVSKLKLYHQNPAQFASRQSPPPPVDFIDDEPLYAIEAILDKRKFRKTWKYLVKWKGYDEQDSTWEPLSHLEYCADLVAEYDATH